MHSVRFRDLSGTVRTGKWIDDEIIASGDTFLPETVDILPPTVPSKVIGIGSNYPSNPTGFQRVFAVFGRALDWSRGLVGGDVSDRPVLFLQGPNSVVGDDATVTLPRRSERFAYGPELGVVVKKQCRYIRAEDANSVIAGYTCANDVTEMNELDREKSWVRAKAFDGAVSIGPVLATPDSVPADATIELRLNEETEEEGSIDKMQHSVPELVEEITAYLTLQPGDVILTGTVGLGPLSDGDQVEVSIEGIGTLRHRIHCPEDVRVIES